MKFFESRVYITFRTEKYRSKKNFLFAYVRVSGEEK